MVNRNKKSVPSKAFITRSVWIQIKIDRYSLWYDMIMTMMLIMEANSHYFILVAIVLRAWTRSAEQGTNTNSCALFLLLRIQSTAHNGKCQSMQINLTTLYQLNKSFLFRLHFFWQTCTLIFCLRVYFYSIWFFFSSFAPYSEYYSVQKISNIRWKLSENGMNAIN